MKIVTVSREFGSGGRELGKRLSEALGFAYYDRELITALAERLSMDESYIAAATEKSVLSQLPLTFSRTLTRSPSPSVEGSYLLAKQHRLLRELAEKSDCVIVGRAADAVLRDYRPVTLFVYADLPSKIARCRARASEDEQLTDREWEKRIKQVDRARAENYSLVSGTAWGDMHGYQLCLNTSGVEIEELVPGLAEYVRLRFERMRP